MINKFKLLALSGYEQKEADRYYRRYHREMIPHLSYKDFTEFSRTGERIGYEKKYFSRRNRLNSTFMMYVTHGDAYLAELCDLIWAICDEFTWALPAHAAPEADAYKCIDLFNAETALTLTELSYFLGNDLPTAVRGRISYEVQRRVILPFESETQQWESARHNWAAVCGGCIGMIYLYIGLPVPDRIFSALSSYLDGMKDDGACLEGLGYWSYGFGYFMYFAALLHERTGRRIYDTDKVRAIARFQQNMYFGPEAISCSDASPDASPLMGLTGLLCTLFKGEVIAPPVQGVRLDECGRWAHYVRSYLYSSQKGAVHDIDAFYPLSQWYIKKNSQYGFFIKGGTNNEPHNHNDIGSFILADKHGQVLCDIGCGEYTSDYFNEEKRYSYLCNSSLGHSVPIIDGNGQAAGEGYGCGDFSLTHNTIELEIGGAYGDGIHIRRRITLLEKGIRLTDSFDFDDNMPHKVTDRLISRLRPEIRGELLHIGSFRTTSIPEISVGTVRDHNGKDIEIYLMDFTVTNGVFETEFLL